MTRGGTRSIATLAAAALVAMLLAACGGSDSSDSSSSASTGESPGGGSKQSASQQQKGSGGKQGSGDEKESQSFEGKQHTVAEVSTPLKVSGGGSEQFLTKGGDNSIQEFGEESDESELEEAAKAVHDFYVARATGAWADACSYTSATLREQLEQLAKKSNVKGCPPFLESFTTELSAAQWREITEMDAGSLRRDGEQGFLIYTGVGKTIYAMPLADEDGEWKVTALSATPLS